MKISVIIYNLEMFYGVYNQCRLISSVKKKKLCSILIYIQQDSTLFSLFYLETALHVFKVHGSVHRNNILIYIQQDATLRSLFYLETALHVSGGTTTHHQERKQLYLQHLVFVRPLLLPAAYSGR